MAEYIAFSEEILSACVSFIRETPIFWIVGLVLFCFIIKAFKLIIKP